MSRSADHKSKEIVKRLVGKVLSAVLEATAVILSLSYSSSSFQMVHFPSLFPPRF